MFRCTETIFDLVLEASRFCHFTDKKARKQTPGFCCFMKTKVVIKCDWTDSSVCGNLSSSDNMSALVCPYFPNWKWLPLPSFLFFGFKRLVCSFCFPHYYDFFWEEIWLKTVSFYRLYSPVGYCFFFQLNHARSCYTCL